MARKKLRAGAKPVDQLSCFEASAMLFLVFSLLFFALWSLWQVYWVSAVAVGAILAYFLFIYAKKACANCLQKNCPVKQFVGKNK